MWVHYLLLQYCLSLGTESSVKCRLAPQLAQHRALAVQTRVAIPREPFDPFENRGRVEMGFDDHLKLQTAGEPLVVPVGRQRILVGQRPDSAERPHAAGAGDRKSVV